MVKINKFITKKDYKNRFDIYKVCQFLENELNININNIIIGEIYIKEEDLDKDIQIINSFENVKNENQWKDKDDGWEYENEKKNKREYRNKNKWKIN